jgi:hypothetical protein
MKRNLLLFLITFLSAFVIINWIPVKNTVFLRSVDKVDLLKPLLVSILIMIILLVDQRIKTK